MRANDSHFHTSAHGQVEANKVSALEIVVGVKRLAVVSR